MDIASLTSTATTPSAAPAAGTQDLGRDEFLRMLIAQLENQDPLNPQDATEFTAQLAQFSSLDQLFGMRASLDALSKVQSASQALSAASLIGRRVTAETSRVEIPASGAPPELSFEVDTATSVLGAELRDANGAVVARLGATDLAAGRTQLSWSALGGVPPAGVYTLAATPAGGFSAPRVLVDARVTGATFASGAPTLLLGSVAIPVSQVRQVRE
jgi:flagellar basal-body rod modification protein FlgD